MFGGDWRVISSVSEESMVMKRRGAGGREGRWNQTKEHTREGEGERMRVSELVSILGKNSGARR